MKEIAAKIIESCGLVANSKDWREYERAKQYIRDNHSGLAYFRYYKVIQIIVKYLGL